jgi:3-hydroxyisobutyrate dehydrogenase-like beta-hydroxyacid dehydrogenase
VYPAALKTWAPTGSQNVQLAVNGIEKDLFTVMAAVTAARTKLPLCMIAAQRFNETDAEAIAKRFAVIEMTRENKTRRDVTKLTPP